MKGDILCREHIANKDLLHVLRLDACTLDGSYKGVSSIGLHIQKCSYS
jgi:hypothetical protein